MDNIIDIEKRIAIIVDAVEEAFVSMGAAMRFAEYLMEDSERYKAEERTRENIHKLECELPEALAWITTAVINVSLLKKETEELLRGMDS